MDESGPKQNTDKETLEQKRFELKGIIARAHDLDIESGEIFLENSLQNRIVEFANKFQEKHGKKFVLFHDLISSSLPQEVEKIYPFDTEDHEVEKFIRGGFKI